MREKKKPTKLKPKEQKSKPAIKGRYKPGESGNPKGRPKGSKNRYSIAELWHAIERVESKKGVKRLLDHFIGRAYKNDQVLIAVMKKLLPDLKSIDGLIATIESSMSEELAKSIQEKLRERYVESA